jgi:hypothetical protein
LKKYIVIAFFTNSKDKVFSSQRGRFPVCKLGFKLLMQPVEVVAEDLAFGFLQNVGSDRHKGRSKLMEVIHEVGPNERSHLEVRQGQLLSTNELIGGLLLELCRVHHHELLNLSFPLSLNFRSVRAKTLSSEPIPSWVEVVEISIDLPRLLGICRVESVTLSEHT